MGLHFPTIPREERALAQSGAGRGPVDGLDYCGFGDMVRGVADTLQEAKIGVWKRLGQGDRVNFRADSGISSAVEYLDRN